MNIRTFHTVDADAVVELWPRCGLTTSQNSPCKVELGLLRNTLFAAALFFFIQGPAVANEAPRINEPLPSYRFDIAGHVLSDALLALSEQSGYSIVFTSSLLRDYKSTPIVGPYSVSGALTLLLSKTNLSFRLDHNARMILIVREDGTHLAHKDVSKPHSPREEVQIVSARHRDEDILRVPMSITAIGGDFIEQSGVQDLIQLGDYVPSTSLRTIRGTNTSLAIYIRGVGHDDPVAGLETSVGVYIDDVYFARPQGIPIDVYDVERVEILRGPQGTLYGRNTIGGAVKYVTKPIGDEPSLKIKGAVGSYSQRDLVLTAGVPLTSSVKVGGSIASLERDGFGKNLTTGETHYNKDVLMYRASLEVSPVDDILLRISYDRTNDQSASRSGYLVKSSAAFPTLAREYDTRAGATAVGHPINKNDIVIKGLSANLDWQINESLRLKFISAKREDISRLPSDLDAIDLVIADGFAVYDNEQVTNELRLSYTAENYDVLWGAYSLESKALSVFDVPALPIVIPGMAAQLNTVQGTFDELELDSYSSYFSYTQQLSEVFQATLGVRYTAEQRKLIAIQNIYTETSSGLIVSPFFGGDGVSISPVAEYRDENGNSIWPKFVGERRNEAVTPRLSLSWHPSGDTHIYASYSKGFKSGGYAPRGIFTDADLRKGFRPEKINAYELGLKSVSFGGSLETQMDVFYSDYEDMQLVESALIDINADGTKDISGQVVMNAESSTVKGIELSAQLEHSARWQSMLGIGFVKTNFESFRSLAGASLEDEREFVSAPELTLSLTQSYNLDALWGELQLLGALHYQSESTFFHAPSQPVDQGAYTIVNLSANWSPSASDRWSLGVSVLNATDTRYRTGAVYLPGFSAELPDGDLMSVYYGNPRTLSLSLSYTF